jgi:hypothetical protein
MPAGKRSNFVTVSADRHGAPAPPVRAGSVVEKETTPGIGTEAQARVRAFGNYFGCRARHRGKQPLQAAFAGNELNLPPMTHRDQFIVPFSDPEDFVHRFDPLTLDFLPVQNRIKREAQGISEPLGPS